MSTPSDRSDEHHDLQKLRRQARLNQLRLKIAQQNESLAALRRSGFRDTLEDFYDEPGNFFNPRDYLCGTALGRGGMPSSRNDRDEGRNYPFFRSEPELAVIRGAARLLVGASPIAGGILTSLTNYVIGNGFSYVVTPRKPEARELAAVANEIIDDFLRDNDWPGDLDRELFQRSRVDGEYFLGLWHVGGGRVQARAIEPNQVTQPSNPQGLQEWLGARADRPGNWAFGVYSDEDDAQAVHGYYVQWSIRDQDWDFLPGGNEPIIPPAGGNSWLEHARLNVVRSVKRGLSDFFSIENNLDLARRVLRNMGEGSAVQAAIAWIQEMAPGTLQAQASSATLTRADASYTTLSANSSRTHYVQQYDPATILKVPHGQKYLPGPLGAQHAPQFITVAEALLRTVALRWNLPEHLVTGSAANNNFASSLVAETPFVKYAETQQQYYARRDKRTLERVLWFAWTAGRFGDAPWPLVQRSLDITITPPQIEVRDPEKETRVRQMLHEASVLSRQTWSAQEGLDFDQEQKNLRGEAEAQPSAPSANTPSANHRRSAESLEADWDSSKHPRGGNPENRGQFSTGAGGGESSGADDAENTQRIEPALDLNELHRHQDAQGLAKVADEIFKNKPVDQWLSAAQEHLQASQQNGGRQLAEELKNKFLEYVQERQRQAQFRAEFENLLLHPPITPQDSSGDDGEIRETVLDLAQVGLDLVGIVDPSPTADGTNTFVSLFRGDFVGAAISAAGMIPYIGDLAKLGKLGRYPQKIARAIALAAKSKKAKAALAPVLKRLQQLLNRIPLDKLPKKLSEPLERMKKQLDGVFKPAENVGGRAAETVTSRRGVSRIGTSKPGTTEVPIEDLIHTHPVPRSEKSISDTVSQLKEGYDVSKPIPVVRMGDGKLILAGGNHRLAAMKELGEKTIPSRIVDWSSLPDRTKDFYRSRFPDVFGGY